MKNLTAIAVLLLIFGPAYGREKHSVRKVGALKAALTASEEAGDTEGTDTNDEQMDNDTDTDNMDTGEQMDTDGQDMPDMDMNDDTNNDTDDMDDTTTTVKSAIQNALKASALKHSEKPFGGLATALDAGLNAQQTITQLLEPAGSGTTQQGASGGSVAVGTGRVTLASDAAIAASGSSSAGKL